MNLENLTTLVEGNVTNSPSITSFNDVSFKASKVKRGDLFVALDHTEIDEAILNGAYGILFEKPTQITDQEIAWIKVTSIDNALLRLLRFHILQRSPEVYFSDAITAKLASQLLLPNSVIVLNTSIEKHLQSLWNLEENSIILFSPSLIDKNLFVDAKEMPYHGTNAINVVEQTLFETSFIYNDTYYERALLSPFFMPYLEKLLEFFRQKKLPVHIREFKPINHFKPVFTNVHFQIKEFGKSDNVLIFEPDISLAHEQIKFLQSQASWAKIIYILPSNMQEVPNCYYYSDITDIYLHLKKAHYHFALIAGVNESILDQETFRAPEVQPTLF